MLKHLHALLYTSHALSPGLLYNSASQVLKFCSMSLTRIVIGHALPFKPEVQQGVVEQDEIELLHLIDRHVLCRLSLSVLHNTEITFVHV